MSEWDLEIDNSILEKQERREVQELAKLKASNKLFGQQLKKKFKRIKDATEETRTEPININY